MTCDDVRRLAPDAALELLDEPRRSEVLAHVAGCLACRAELAALAATADLLLLAAPPAEPPPGFEARVLDRLATATATPTRRRWAVPAVAAALAAVVGLGAGVALGGGGGDGGGGGADLVAARLLGGGGEAVGQVLVSDEPDRMVCVLDGAPAGIRYDVRVHDGDGWRDVGTFTSGGPGVAWTTDLPVDGGEVRRVQVLDVDGGVRASAELH